jgi:hypothetical protein
MIEILPPLLKYKYDTWRILPVKCYINNSVSLQSSIRNVNSGASMRVWLSAGVHVWLYRTLLWIGFLIYDG